MTPEELQLIVEERKAEKKREAEAKRLDGLRRISEMKSRTGIDPLARFPAEIWTMIMQDISAKDRANMSQVHPTFQGWTERHRIRDILLPLTLDHEIPFLEGLLPSLGDPRGSLHQLKILRLVSKATKDSVDKWIEEDLLHSMRTSSEIPRLEPIKFMQLRWIKDTSRTYPILTDSKVALEDMPKKVFTRALKVLLSPSVHSLREEAVLRVLQHMQRSLGEHAHFKDNVAEFLKKAGDQILYFHLDITGNCQPKHLKQFVPLICGALREYLTHMPNLRWLKVKAVRIKYPRVRRRQTDWRKFGSQEMPRLRNLERVDVWACKEFRMCDSVLKANPHVKFYNHRSVDTNERYMVEPAVLRLPLEVVDFGGLQWDLPLLRQVSDSKWKLKELKLKLDDMSAIEEMDQVFECLEKIPTLETLHLRMDNGTITGELNYLRLPNLKNLKLDLGSEMTWEGNVPPAFFFSLKFLMHCGKLESLTWNSHACLRYSEMEEGLIGFRGGVEDLRVSNVWDVFPWLRLIELEVRDGGKYIESEFRDRELVRKVEVVI